MNFLKIINYLFKWNYFVIWPSQKSLFSWI